MEILRVNVILLYKPQQSIHQLRVVQIRPGNVDGDRHQPVPIQLPLMQHAAGGFPYKPVQLKDKAVPLEQRYKFRRGNGPQLGTEPPGQCLGACQRAGLQLYLGLEIDLKFSVSQSLSHGGGKCLLPQTFAAEGVVIDGGVPVKLPLDAVDCHQSPVAHQLHGNRAVVNLKNAPANHGTPQNRVLVSAFRKQRLFRLHTHHIRPLQTQEPICAEPSAEAGGTQRLLDTGSNLPQKPVAFLHAEAVVNHFEVFDIGADNAVAILRIVPQGSPYLFVEIVLAVHAGKPVKFQRVDHGRGFPQLDDAGDPVQHHLGMVGLGNKIRGAPGKGIHLVLHAVVLGHDDDGNQRKLRIRAHGVQKFVAIHHGHDEIQQDQGNAAWVAAQNIQCFPPVFRRKNRISILKNRSEHFPIDGIILNNKNLSLWNDCHAFLPVLSMESGLFRKSAYRCGRKKPGGHSPPENPLRSAPNLCQRHFNNFSVSS